MLASENLDVVSVCTPTLYHHQHVVDAARLDAAPDIIWCEKPTASSVTEANEMISVCKALLKPPSSGGSILKHHRSRFQLPIFSDEESKTM
jgi:hypothetical protein